MKWVQSESTQRPELIDTLSSKTRVYMRRNIEQKWRTDDLTGDSQEYFAYEEAKLTKEEYEEYLKNLAVADIEQQRADIDYIAICCNVDIFN